MNARDADNLRDLPSLESVETTHSAAALLIGGAFAAVISALGVWGWIVYGNYLGAVGISGVLVVLALAAWCFVRIAFSPISMKTDADGLTVRSLVSSRTIRWRDVIEARYRLVWTGRILLLRTPRCAFALSRPLAGTVSPENSLVASIWQHLRRASGVEPFKLDRITLSLWQEIGDEAPHVVRWGRTPSWTTKAATVVGLAAVVALLAYLWLDSGAKPAAAAMLGVMTFGYGAVGGLLVMPDVLRRARSIAVDDAGMDVETLFSRVRIAWNEVVTAEWRVRALCVRAANPSREVRIPSMPCSEELRQTHSAVARGIRSAAPHILLPIPTNVPREKLADDPLWRDYNRMQSVLVFPVLLGVMLGLLVIALNVPGLISKLIHDGPATRFFFPGSAWPFALPAIIGGLALGALVGRWIAVQTIRVDSPLWREYGNVQLWVSERVARRAVPALVAIGLVLLLLTVNSYLEIADSGLRLNGFGSVRSICYQWAEIRSIDLFTVAANRRGDAGPVHICTVRFRDGSNWVFSDDNRADLVKDDVVGAVEFIARRSGLRVSYR